MIIVLHGKCHSGKDTIANYLVEKYNFTRLAFADIPKQIIKQTLEYIFDDTIEDIEIIKDKIYYKQKTFRDILQRFSTEICQTIMGKCIWTDLILEQIQENTNYIITDLRFEHEYNKVSKLKNVFFIHLFRPILNENQNENENHSSNQKLNIDFHYYIYNNSTKKELYNSIENILNKIFIC